MKTMHLVLCVLGLGLTSPAFGQINEAIETNWKGVTAKLVTCHQDECHFYVQVVFENRGENEVRSGSPIYFKDIYLLDPNTDTKVIVLKDAKGIYLGGPSSDRNDGGPAI